MYVYFIRFYIFHFYSIKVLQLYGNTTERNLIYFGLINQYVNTYYNTDNDISRTLLMNRYLSQKHRIINTFYLIVSVQL